MNRRDPEHDLERLLEADRGEFGAIYDRLARTDGVICPPRDVDPDIHSAPPGGGRTPVIPPPGSPGGDPSVQPK